MTDLQTQVAAKYKPCPITGVHEEGVCEDKVCGGSGKVPRWPELREDCDAPHHGGSCYDCQGRGWVGAVTLEKLHEAVGPRHQWKYYRRPGAVECKVEPLTQGAKSGRSEWQPTDLEAACQAAMRLAEAEEKVNA